MISVTPVPRSLGVREMLFAGSDDVRSGLIPAGPAFLAKPSRQIRTIRVTGGFHFVSNFIAASKASLADKYPPTELPPHSTDHSVRILPVISSPLFGFDFVTVSKLAHESKIQFNLFVSGANSCCFRLAICYPLREN